jgi:hypothetical protein
MLELPSPLAYVYVGMMIRISMKSAGIGKFAKKGEAGYCSKCQHC